MDEYQKFVQKFMQKACEMNHDFQKLSSENQYRFKQEAAAMLRAAGLTDFLTQFMNGKGGIM